MPFNVKGISVEIGADTTKLTAALKQIKQEYAGLERSASSLKRSMTFQGKDIGGVESQIIHQKLLREQIEMTRKNLEAYDKAIKNFDENFKQLRKDTDEHIAESKKLVAQRDAEKENLKSLQAQHKAATKNYEAQAKAVKELSTEVEGHKIKQDRLKTALKGTDVELESLKHQFQQGRISLEDYHEGELGILRTKAELTKAELEEGVALEAAKSKLNEKTLALEAAQKQTEALGAKVEASAKQVDDLSNAYAKECDIVERNTAVLKDQEKQRLALEAAQQKDMNALRAYQEQLTGLTDAQVKAVYQLDKFAETAEKVAEKFDKAANAVKPFSMLAAAGLAGAIGAAISFEDAWAGVTKTVDGTPEQLRAINDGLKELATSTSSSYETIAKNAEMAGQMGVATDNVVEFTRVVTMLGDTTNLVGEEAAQSIAKFANVMTDSKVNGEVTMDYYSRLGSTIVDLGNNFATTEADIMEMSMRMAAAGSQMGMSSPQVLALSTALSSMGLKTAEAGGSMSKLMQQITLAVATGNDKLPAFAEAAGMSAEEFQQAWGEDAPQAFLKFLEGISSAEDGSERLQRMSDAGVASEIRMARSVGALTGSIDVYKEALKAAGVAWEENTAMTAEAEKRYATLKSQISQLWESVKQLANELGVEMVPALKNIVGEAKDWVKGLSKMDTATKQSIIKIGLFTAALYPALKGLSSTTMAAVKTASAISKTAKAYSTWASEGTKSYQTFKAFTGFLTSAHGLALAGVTAAVIGACAAYKKMRERAVEAYEANTYLDEVLEDLSKRNQQTIEEVKEHNKAAYELAASYKRDTENTQNYLEKLERLQGLEHLTNAQKAELKALVEQLNQLYPELNLQIDENTGKVVNETGSNQEATKAIREKIAALQEEAKERIKNQILEETTMAQTKAQMGYLETLQQRKELVNEMSRLENEYGLRTKEGLLDGNKLLSEQGAAWMSNREKLKELNGSLTEYQQLMADGRAEMERQLNFLETGGYDAIGEGMKKSFQELAAAAAAAGVEIPARLSESITNGSATVNEAANFMASQVQLQELIGKADEAGRQMISGIVSQIYANAPDLATASARLSEFMSFMTLYNSSEAAGTEIPQHIANGLANGSYTAEGAMAEMSMGLVKTNQEGNKQIEDNTKTTTGVVKEDWSNSMNSASKSASTASSSIVADFGTVRSSADTVVKGIDNIGFSLDRLNGRSATVTVNYVKNESGGGSGGAVHDAKAKMDVYNPEAARAYMQAAPEGTDFFSTPLVRDAVMPSTSQVNPFVSVVKTSLANAILSRMTQPAAQGLSGLGKELAGIIGQMGNQNITIEVPVIFDGREVARVTAPYVRENLAEMDALQNRLQGVFA